MKNLYEHIFTLYQLLYMESYKNGYSLLFKVINNKAYDTPSSTWAIKDREFAQLNTKCLKCFLCALKSNDYMPFFTSNIERKFVINYALHMKGLIMLKILN